MLHAVNDGRHLQSLARDGDVPKTSVACAPTDMLIASAARDGSVQIWDGYTGMATGSYQLHDVGPPLRAHSTSELREGCLSLLPRLSRTCRAQDQLLASRLPARSKAAVTKLGALQRAQHSSSLAEHCCALSSDCAPCFALHSCSPLQPASSPGSACRRG